MRGFLVYCLAAKVSSSQLEWLQGVLHWVGQPQPGQDPPRFEARLYDRLFTTQTPGSKKKKAGEGEDAGAAAGQGESWSSVMWK